MKKKGIENSAPHQQLDKLIDVPLPRHWLLLFAVLIFLSGAGVWGVYGEIPTTVPGKGMLMRQDAGFDVLALGTGQVIELTVRVDDMVRKDQVIGRIRQKDLENTIVKMESHLAMLRKEEELVSTYGQKKFEKQADFLEQRQKSLTTAIQLGEERLTHLKGRLANYKKMVEQGIVSRDEYLKSKNEYDKTVKEVMEYRDQIAELQTKGVDSASSKDRENIDIRLEVLKVEKELDSLRARLESTSQIISPRAGRVVEVFDHAGGVVTVGEAVVRLEVSSPEDELHLVAYFSPYQGKKITPGMEIHIVPSTVRQEEFGYVLGRVEHVSLFPATRQGMLHVLGNEALVRDLSAGGAPITVKARLDKNAAAMSGYRWSSGEGPPLLLQAGTLCSVSVEIRSDPPLTLVFPELKRLFIGATKNTVK